MRPGTLRQRDTMCSGSWRSQSSCWFLFSAPDWHSASSPPDCSGGSGPDNFDVRRRGQVVRRQTANLLFVSSILTGASIRDNDLTIFVESCPLHLDTIVDTTGDKVQLARRL